MFGFSHVLTLTHGFFKTPGLPTFGRAAKRLSPPRFVLCFGEAFGCWAVGGMAWCLKENWTKTLAINRDKGEMITRIVWQGHQAVTLGKQGKLSQRS